MFSFIDLKVWLLFIVSLISGLLIVSAISWFYIQMDANRRNINESMRPGPIAFVYFLNKFSMHTIGIITSQSKY